MDFAPTPPAQFRAPDEERWAWSPHPVVYGVSQYVGRSATYKVMDTKTGQQWGHVSEADLLLWNPDWVPSVPPLTPRQKNEALVEWIEELCTAWVPDLNGWELKLERLKL